MKVGYARVSTQEQNTIRQEVLMEELGVGRLYIDKVSGKDTNRPELTKLMAFVREGDVLIVESISRFARSTRDFLSLMDELNRKQVQFISQKEKLDSETPQGRFMMVVFAALAELERENILQRQREGIECAKQEGKYKGRPPKKLEEWEDIYGQWKEGKITLVDASSKLGVSRSTFYRRANAMENQKN